MDGRESPFAMNYSTGDTSKTKFPEGFILEEQEKVGFEEEGSTCLYAIWFKEVDHLRRHTRSYVKNLGGLKAIPTLPRRNLLILKIQY